jgi:hypothetical protein
LVPPCIRQRRLPRTAGARHGRPFLVLAPQRGLWCMDNLLRMGLLLGICRIPLPPRTGLDIADDRLTTLVHVHVLDSHLLLALFALRSKGDGANARCAGVRGLVPAARTRRLARHTRPGSGQRDPRCRRTRSGPGRCRTGSRPSPTRSEQGNRMRECRLGVTTRLSRPAQSRSAQRPTAVETRPNVRSEPHVGRAEGKV